MNSKKEYQSEEQHEPMFEMPECEFFSLTCGSCMYYEQYGFGKAFCNYHERDTSSSDTACGYYKQATVIPSRHRAASRRGAALSVSLMQGEDADVYLTKGLN